MVGDTWNSLFFLQSLPMRAAYVFDDASNEACGYKNAFLRLIYVSRKFEILNSWPWVKSCQKFFSVLFGPLTLVREWMVQKGSRKTLMFGLPLIVYPSKDTASIVYDSQYLGFRITMDCDFYICQNGKTFSSMIVVRVKITSSTAMSCKLVQLQGQRLLRSTIGLQTQ